jgi:hypothetical protein
MAGAARNSLAAGDVGSDYLNLALQEEDAMTRIAVLILAVLATAPVARADTPGPDWMPAEKVIEKVLLAGYTQVTKIEADDGRWEGEGIKNGKKMEFHADPKTGAITHEKPDN